jgi:hypothetical protein
MFVELHCFDGKNAVYHLLTATECETPDSLHYDRVHTLSSHQLYIDTNGIHFTLAALFMVTSMLSQ